MFHQNLFPDLFFDNCPALFGKTAGKLRTYPDIYRCCQVPDKWYLMPPDDWHAQRTEGLLFYKQLLSRSLLNRYKYSPDRLAREPCWPSRLCFYSSHKFYGNRAMPLNAFRRVKVPAQYHASSWKGTSYFPIG